MHIRIETEDESCSLDTNIPGCNQEKTDEALVISIDENATSDSCQKKCLAIPDCSKAFFSQKYKVCVYLKDNCTPSSSSEDAGLFYNCSKKTGQLNQ